MTIRRAARESLEADLDVLVPLFDAYRVFYRRPPDPEGARAFLRNRLARAESVVLIAFEGARAIGFTQLYPSFSSASMAAIFVLNDLFVSPEARRGGVGSALLEAAVRHARESGAVRLTLSTEVSNHAAQSVYERNGWTRDTAFYVYNLPLDPALPPDNTPR